MSKKYQRDYYVKNRVIVLANKEKYAMEKENYKMVYLDDKKTGTDFELFYF